METNFIIQLLEKGIIEGLFVLCFVLFVWKGAPYIIKRMDEREDALRKERKEDQKAYMGSLKEEREHHERSLTKIVDTFNEATKTSKEWHERHNQKLDEIKDLVAKK